MNGRCETDPFDQAINVCGMCFGEYCQSCLVSVRGRKHPLCKECAIVSAGLRAGAKPAVRGSRKTAKARRQTLAEAPRQESFQFFEPQPLAGAASADEPDSTETPERRSDDKVTAGETGATSSEEVEGKQNKPKKGKRKGRSKAKKGEPVEVEETIDIGARLGGSAAPGAETVTFGELDERSAAGSAPSNQSAVHQLDRIRAENGADGEEPSFRRPRPFVKGLAADDAPESGSTKPKKPTEPKKPAETKKPAEAKKSTSTSASASASTKAETAGAKKPAADDRPDRHTMPKRRPGPSSEPKDDRRAKPALEDFDDSDTKVAAPKDGEVLPTLPRRREKNRNHVRKTPKATSDASKSSRSGSRSGDEGGTAEAPSFGRLNDPFEPPAWTQQDRRKRQRKLDEQSEPSATEDQDDAVGAEVASGAGQKLPKRRKS